MIGTHNRVVYSKVIAQIETFLTGKGYVIFGYAESVGAPIAGVIVDVSGKYLEVVIGNLNK